MSCSGQRIREREGKRAWGLANHHTTHLLGRGIRPQTIKTLSKASGVHSGDLVTKGSLKTLGSNQRHVGSGGKRVVVGVEEEVGKGVALKGMLFYRRSITNIAGTSNIPMPPQPPSQGLRFEPLNSHQHPTLSCQRPYLSSANHRLASLMPY